MFRFFSQIANMTSPWINFVSIKIIEGVKEEHAKSCWEKAVWRFLLVLNTPLYFYASDLK